MGENEILAKLLKQELSLLLNKYDAFITAEYDREEDQSIEPYITVYINKTDGKYQSSSRVILGEEFE